MLHLVIVWQNQLPLSPSLIKLGVRVGRVSAHDLLLLQCRAHLHYQLACLVSQQA